MGLSGKRGAPHEAYIAISLRRGEAADLRALAESRFMWNAWKRHYWPLDVIRPGLKLYGFDKHARRFVVLLEITKGGAFAYKSRSEFVRSVKRLTGWKPWLNDPGYHPPPLPEPGKQNSGLAIRWKVLKPVDIAWKGRFPQLGWLKLDQADEVAGLPDIEELGLAVPEGARRLVEHFRRERNPVLVTRKKRQVRERTGRLACEACAFDFAETYGRLGIGFAEVHHRVPLSHLTEQRNTSLADLAILCSNCHRMIHKTKPFLNVVRFRRLLKNGA